MRKVYILTVMALMAEVLMAPSVANVKVFTSTALDRCSDRDPLDDLLKGRGGNDFLKGRGLC
jgi:hypothetical protein